jgi:hypothetical protein
MFACAFSISADSSTYRTLKLIVTASEPGILGV